LQEEFLILFIVVFVASAEQYRRLMKVQKKSVTSLLTALQENMKDIPVLCHVFRETPPPKADPTKFLGRYDDCV